jgi:hypothetical protein
MMLSSSTADRVSGIQTPATAKLIALGLDRIARHTAHARIQFGVQSLELVLDLGLGLAADLPADPLPVRVKAERNHPAPASRTGLVEGAVPAVAR